MILSSNLIVQHVIQIKNGIKKIVTVSVKFIVREEKITIGNRLFLKTVSN